MFAQLPCEEEKESSVRLLRKALLGQLPGPASPAPSCDRPGLGQEPPKEPDGNSTLSHPEGSPSQDPEPLFQCMGFCLGRPGPHPRIPAPGMQPEPPPVPCCSHISLGAVVAFPGNGDTTPTPRPALFLMPATLCWVMGCCQLPQTSTYSPDAPFGI